MYQSFRPQHALFGFVILFILVFVLYYLPSGTLDRLLVPASRKCVYFDLGANTGDSLENFFGFKSYGGGGDFSKLFPDNLIEKNKWIVHAYEANPVFNDSLSRISQQIASNGHKAYMNYQTAAWIYDGTIDFYLDTVNPGVNFWGSSLNKNAGDVVRSNQTKVTVACHDIAKILKQYSADDMIIMKMDIEGAEYDLLVDFLKKDVVKLIDYVAIEYHRSLATYQHADEILDIVIQLQNAKKIYWH